jgi:hypothetical protein
MGHGDVCLLIGERTSCDQREIRLDWLKLTIPPDQTAEIVRRDSFYNQAQR